jgi:flagellar basal-body rod protein FlgC
MVSPVNIAVSGLVAASTRLAVSANNIANQASTQARVDGKVVDRPFVPQVVDQVSLSTGGVQAIVRDAKSSDVKPDAKPDDEVDDKPPLQVQPEGFAEARNVDVAKELIAQKIAAYDYEANLKTLKINDRLQKSLLDILA